VITTPMELDDAYHVVIKDKRGRRVGKVRAFETLEGLLGFLHHFDNDGKSCRNMLACLMGLRDGPSEAEIYRKEFKIGRQVLQISPSKKYHELFWKGFEL